MKTDRQVVKAGRVNGRTCWTGLLCLGWALAAGVGAAPAQSETLSVSNTVITSDSLSFDYQKRVAVFDGNVKAVDPQMRATADHLTVTFDETNEVKTVIAQGSVNIYHEDKHASCKRAVYTAQTGQVVLTGNAALTRGGDKVMGRRITFWLNEERMLSEPGRLILYPEDGARTNGASRLVPRSARTRKEDGARK